MKIIALPRGLRPPLKNLLKAIKERESQLLSAPWTPEASLELDQLIVTMDELGITWVRGLV